jgi:phage baseplate assembly protein W
MAIDAKNINPLDLRRSTGIGIGFPFSDIGTFSTTYTTQESTKVNLINYLLTNAGERVLSPLFGGSMPLFIFEQITEGSLEQFKRVLEDRIRANFPDIEVQEILVTSTNPDNSTVGVTIKNVMKRFNVTDTITLSITT